MCGTVSRLGGADADLPHHRQLRRGGGCRTDDRHSVQSRHPRSCRTVGGIQPRRHWRRPGACGQSPGRGHRDRCNGQGGGSAGKACGWTRCRCGLAAPDIAFGTCGPANLALVSVPGDFAAAEARKALRAGLHVMLFSDNVPLAEEVALKREAAAAGLLVMGPDCGTAIIGGVPLAFANRIPRGDIGIVGASGTGMQEVSSLIAQAGHGISHALGVGGRDLSDPVGGISTLAALAMLDADPATRHVVLISKPPSPSVAKRIIDTLARSEKTLTICFIGGDTPPLPDNVTFARTLKAAAELATGTSNKDTGSEFQYTISQLAPGRQRIHGLFSGGTLAAEAQVVFLDHGVPVASNVPIPEARAVRDMTGHVLVDLGDDEYTKGRPHPMIEPALRDVELAKALANPTTAVVLLDVVIGFGAHPDPAGAIVRVVAAAGTERPIVIASVTGTNDDPQDRRVQVAKLVDAGVVVAPTNADAAALALRCLVREG